VSKDHVHLYIEFATKLSISEISKQLKITSSRLLQKEFPGLYKQYSGSIFGRQDMMHVVQETLLMKWCKIN